LPKAEDVFAWWETISLAMGWKGKLKAPQGKDKKPKWGEEKSTKSYKGPVGAPRLPGGRDPE